MVDAPDGHAPFDALELADAVQAIRDGLVAATARGAGSPLAFELGEIHMEFTVELRRDRKAGGGARAWVLTGAAEASRSRGHTHTVSFTLHPKQASDGTGWLVGDDDPGDASGFPAAGYGDGGDAYGDGGGR
jgi:hypothetical protein